MDSLFILRFCNCLSAFPDSTELFRKVTTCTGIHLQQSLGLPFQKKKPILSTRDRRTNGKKGTVLLLLQKQQLKQVANIPLILKSHFNLVL